VEGQFNLMNVLKALASIVSMCNLHVILLSKITLFTNGMFCPFNVRRESGAYHVLHNRTRHYTEGNYSYHSHIKHNETYFSLAPCNSNYPFPLLDPS
jgi:hypothetical protein